MNAIGRGDWLECIRADVCNCGGAHISPPNVYRCIDLIAPPVPYDRWMCGHCGEQTDRALVMEGQEDHCYCACCFKPGGYRPSENVARALSRHSLVQA